MGWYFWGCLGDPVGTGLIWNLFRIHFVFRKKTSNVNHSDNCFFFGGRGGWGYGFVSSFHNWIISPGVSLFVYLSICMSMCIYRCVCVCVCV